MVSVWLGELRFYTRQPIEENLQYRLPVAECAQLEGSIDSDNEIFARMTAVMSNVEKISGIAADIMPKDIVINFWVGTSTPNPILPVMVLSNHLASDFIVVIEGELEERGKLVKACRTQGFRDDVQDKLDALLDY